MAAKQSRDLIIVGASVRAAAYSALRAGFRPMCADLFADRDLQAVASCLRVSMENYPIDLERALYEFTDAGWMYTGGLENYPELIDAWANRQLLLGNDSSVLKCVRDPKRLAALLRRHKISFPKTGDNELGTPQVVKPIRSAGGRGMRVWNGESLEAGKYLQEMVEGAPVSAVFVFGDGHTSLIGATQQLIGEPWLNAPMFQYCGSVGSTEINRLEQWEIIGKALSECELWGIVGVDAIVNDQKLTVLEVNPRYTASVEVLEHVTGHRVLEQHAACFGQLMEPPPVTGDRPACVGKAVYFAPRSFRFPKQGPWDDELRKPFDPWRLPAYADIPHAGSSFDKGDPVISFFVSGPTPPVCLDLLKRHAKQMPDFLEIQG